MGNWELELYGGYRQRKLKGLELFMIRVIIIAKNKWLERAFLPKETRPRHETLKPNGPKP